MGFGCKTSFPLLAIIAIVAVSAMSMSACFDKPQFVGLACSEAEPCPDGLLCRETTCVAPCVHDDECPSDQERCVGGACTALSTLCSRDEECTSPGACEVREGAVCRNGVCAYRPVECVTPPPSECIERDTTFKSFSSIGTCSRASGLCEYATLSIACPGCTTTCLEACSTIRCDEINGGCRTEGFCTPGDNVAEPPGCMYNDADDGTHCTLEGNKSGVCREGACVGCNQNSDCNDGNPCTDDTCNISEGSCSYANNTGACDDDDACTQGQGTCNNGECLFTARTQCNAPPNECSEGAGECDPRSGACIYPPKSDRTPCTDDNNGCTNDLCDGAGSCEHTAKLDGSLCSDQDTCTSVEACSGGQCVAGTGVVCNAPPGECYEAIGACNAGTGECSYMPRAVDSACSDDDNACTNDICDGFGMCVHRAKADGAACDDLNACTQTDTCQGGACSGDNPVICNVSPGQCYSSAGVCDPQTGTCDYPTQNGVSCTDGNDCTQADTCNGGNCTGTSYSCNDMNACTSDACDGLGGCNYTMIAPGNLASAQTTDHVSMTWRACSDAVHYDVNIEEQDAMGNWFFYFTYDENNPTAPATAQKTLYPIRCNKQMRFRVRSYNGTTHGPWSPFFQFFFSC